jgi:hypothetical protein
MGVLAYLSVLHGTKDPLLAGLAFLHRLPGPPAGRQ